QAVTVTNTGPAPVLMEGAGGAPGGDFSATQTCQGQTLAPGASCQMTFTFGPTSAGAQAAVSSGTWSGVSYQIDLRGAGAGENGDDDPDGPGFTGDYQIDGFLPPLGRRNPF